MGVIDKIYSMNSNVVGISDFMLQKIEGHNLVQSIINQELTGLFGTETLRDMNSILKMYNYYLGGVPFETDHSGKDYKEAELKIQTIKTLIDKEARFMFSIPPDIIVNDPSSSTNSSKDNPDITNIKNLIDSVFEDSKFDSKLIKAAKDCLIGKRIAIVTNFNENSGITITFVPSLEFVYETDPDDVDTIVKFIQFYSLVVNDDKNQQRIYKKKWWLEEDGFCHISEAVYDGNGTIIEEYYEDKKTLLQWIPVEIVINEGLTGDPYGMSDVEFISDEEGWYNKLTSKDIDSLRKSADQITYAIDINPSHTKNLSQGPGAFWDLASDPAGNDKQGRIGTISNSMSYSVALDTSLSRIKQSMYSSLDVPDTSSDALQGIITSGKTMKAIYWGLMVRCDEKMLSWKPAIANTAITIVEGAKLYPAIAFKYVFGSINTDYEIIVDNNYSLLEDETEEKEIDMAEVSAKVRSRKSYMKKWMKMTDEEIDDELEQIMLETQLLEDNNISLPQQSFISEQGGNNDDDIEENQQNGQV